MRLPIHQLTRPPALFLGLLVVTVLLYWPGLRGDFVFDDTHNLLINNQLQLKQLDASSLRAAAFSGEAGLLKRPVSMLSFALNYYFVGSFDPFLFKLTNLGIHLLCGISLFYFLQQLFGAFAAHHRDSIPPVRTEYLALLVTAVWLLHPLAPSVLYVVQRMNSLATLFTLWGLILYLHGGQHLLTGKKARGFTIIGSGILGLGTLAALSKENGLLLPFFALLVETIVYRFHCTSPADRNKLLALFIVVAGLPLLFATGYIVLHPEWLLGPYQIRSFTLWERLMTEARVLWYYLGWIVAPSNSGLGLFHDDIRISIGLLQPVTTLFATLGLATLLIASFVARHRAPLLTFGILWFFLGHGMESSVLALEIVHEHRNYLPMVGILIVVFHLFTWAATRFNLEHLPLAAGLVALILASTITLARASAWSSNTVLSLTEVRHHPDSARLNYDAGRQYALLYDRDKSQRQLRDNSRYHLHRSMELDLRSTNGLFGLIFLAKMDGDRADPALLSELQRRLRFTFVSAFEMLTLDTLAGGQGQERPLLPHEDLTALFDAVLANPLLRPVDRGAALASLSLYYGNHRRAYEEAVILARQAIDAAPDKAVFQVNYANLLIAMQQFDAAREQLKISRSMDKLGVLASEIAENQKLIELYEARSHKPGRHSSVPH